MWGGSRGRVSCGVMEKLGKLGVVSFKLPGFRGHLHWGLPQLYLPGLLTSLSLHPPLPLASKETPPHPTPRPQEEEEMLLVAALGRVVLLGHLLCVLDAQGLEVLGVPVLRQ